MTLSITQLKTLADMIVAELKPPPDVMSTECAAAYLDCSVSLLERMRRDGGGPEFVQPPGFRVVRYTKTSLDKWLASKSVSNNIGGGARAESKP